MVDQVTFPPSIGGSGKTYTNDANPETGMFGGGHRINFFPIQLDMIAAAGYVAQYAQAIDGAKANADRAENARGYVEAVHDAIEINLLDQFKRRATLDFDFARGIYRIDDSSLTQTTNPSDLMTIIRSTPKWTESPDGFLYQSADNQISREWRNGHPKGAVIEPTITNNFLWSEDFTRTVWLTGTQTNVVPSAVKSPDGTQSAQRIESVSDASTLRYIQQSLTTEVGVRYTASYFIKPDEVEWFRFRDTGRQDSYFNLKNGEINAANGVTVLISKSSQGFYRVSISFSGGDVINDVTLYLHDRGFGTNSILSAGDGAYIWGAQFERGRQASSYIPTTTNTVTRNGDTLRRSISREASKSQGTYLIRCPDFPIFQEAFYNYILFLTDAEASSGAGWLGVGFSFSTSGVVSLMLRTATDGDLISVALPPSRLSGEMNLGLSYSEGSLIVTLNGVSYTADTQQSLEGASFLKLFSGSTQSTVIATCSSLTYAPVAATSAELEELTK